MKWQVTQDEPFGELIQQNNNPGENHQFYVFVFQHSFVSRVQRFCVPGSELNPEPLNPEPFNLLCHVGQRLLAACADGWMLAVRANRPFMNPATFTLFTTGNFDLN